MRSRRCSTRCATPFTLAPSSAIGWDVGLAVVFVAGLLLYGIGTAIARTTRHERQAATLERAERAIDWPTLIDDDLTQTDVALRLAMIDRLGLLDTPWSRYVLERAAEQETDEAVIAAVARASAKSSCESTPP